MIIIVAENIANSITRHREAVRGLSRCRRRGYTAGGEPVLLCPRHMLRVTLCETSTVRKIVWDDFTPTEDEEAYARSRTA